MRESQKAHTTSWILCAVWIIAAWRGADWWTWVFLADWAMTAAGAVCGAIEQGNKR